MDLPELFRVFLISQKVSTVTVKNYLVDVNHFLNWLRDRTGIKYQIAGRAIFTLFTKETLNEYKTELIISRTPLSTINRRLSTLRKFGQFAQSQGWLTENPALLIPNVTPEETKVAEPSDTITQLLQNFRKSLEERGTSQITIKNYLSDLRHFLNWLEAG